MADWRNPPSERPPAPSRCSFDLQRIKAGAILNNTGQSEIRPTSGGPTSSPPSAGRRCPRSPNSSTSTSSSTPPSENTLRTLRARLAYATDTFGDTRVDRLDPQAIGGVAEAAPGTVRLGDPQDAPPGPALRGPRQAARREPGYARPEPGAETPRGADVRTVAELELVAEELTPGSRPFRVFAGTDRPAARRVDRARASRRRHPERGRPRPPRVHDGQVKPYGKQTRLAEGRPVACTGRCRARSPSAEDRHAVAVPRRDEADI